MLSQRQIWMETSKWKQWWSIFSHYQKGMREQHTHTCTQTHMEKARTSGRKAVIMSPGLYCGYIMSFPHQTAAPVWLSAFHKTQTAACWSFGHIFSSSFVNNVLWSIVIDLDILIIIIQAPSALSVAVRGWAFTEVLFYIPKKKKSSFQKPQLSHTTPTKNECKTFPALQALQSSTAESK